MELTKILNNKNLDLPKSWGNEKGYDFLENIKNINDNYLKILKNYRQKFSDLELSDSDVTSIESLIEDVNQIISSYLHGNLKNAYVKLDDTLNKMRGNIENLRKNLIPNYTTIHLYRIRYGEDFNKNYEKKHLFHIPFEERFKVETRRYSISGVPCLYLGGSIYICWEEMNRPEFSRMYISRFKIKKNLNVLDFGYRPKWINQNNKNICFGNYNISDNYVKSFIMLWPLIASCSIKVRYPKEKFKPEYIIPQLLLQWVRSEKDIDGIKYFSTKYREGNYELTEFLSNYAFPAKTLKSSGYCDYLSDKFEISNPINWSIADNFRIGDLDGSNAHIELNITEGIKEQYMYSKFGIIESKINSLPTSKII